MLEKTNKIMKGKKMSLSNSQEEYLKNIYLLKNTGEEVKVTTIANKMSITKASVNNAIKSLKEEGLLNYEPYGKIELTEKGDLMALKIIEAYDIVKLFLNDIICVDSNNLDKEATSIKSILSDDTINKIAQYTNKTLGLNDIRCYNISNEKCIKCKKRKEIKK